MAQFQVYRLAGGQLVPDLQTDLIDTGSRVVAPLILVSTGPRVIGLITSTAALQRSKVGSGPPLADVSAAAGNSRIAAICAQRSIFELQLTDMRTKQHSAAIAPTTPSVRLFKK